MRLECVGYDYSVNSRSICLLLGCCWAEELGPNAVNPMNCFAKVPPSQTLTKNVDPRNVWGALRRCDRSLDGVCINTMSHQCSLPLVPYHCNEDIGESVACCPVPATVTVRAGPPGNPNVDPLQEEELDPEENGETPEDDGPTCGRYSERPVKIEMGNFNRKYKLVEILPQQFSGSGADNMFTLGTACAFDKMFDAAAQSGVNVLVVAGFRGLAAQQHFWDLYQCSESESGEETCRSGSGVRPPKPGSSPHGVGNVLKLDIECGLQEKNARPPAQCLANPVYKWLQDNAARFGFVREIETQPSVWTWKKDSRPSPPAFQ